MRGATRLSKAIISLEARWRERSRLRPLLASRPGEGPYNLSLTKESILAQYASSSTCLPLLPGSDINAVATPAMAVVVGWMGSFDNMLIHYFRVQLLSLH